MIDVLGGIAVWAGLILMLIGGLFFIIAAFRESIFWGLGVLFLPFVSLIFLILAWPRAKGPFFLQLYGFIAILIGVLALKAHLPMVHH